MRSKLMITVALVSWLAGCAGDPAETGEEPTDAGEVACDGTDNDGDGLIDEGLGDAPFAMYPDADGDGYGLSEEGVEHTCLLEGYARDGGDCDDARRSVHPGASERCDFQDQDCDGLDVPDGELMMIYPDSDRDRYGSDEGAIEHICAPPRYATLSGDCDDNWDRVHPGATEYCDRADYDCDGMDVPNGELMTIYPDNDRDGFGVDEGAIEYICVLSRYATVSGDCADSWDWMHPGATEYCDLADNDCDGLDVPSGELMAIYPDNDRDGFGVDEGAIEHICVLPWYASVSGDCDDRRNTSYPGSPESCDRVDSDCDGLDVPDGVPMTLFSDGDGDGFGVSEGAIEYICVLERFASVPGDCDDIRAYRFPGADERCNEMDEDCDGEVDEGLLGDTVLIFRDLDGDGHGDGEVEREYGCRLDGYVTGEDDCDDLSAAVYPGAREICDAQDNDCDGYLNSPTSSAKYLDLDLDGVGDEDALVEVGCTDTSAASWLVSRSGDCDPLDPHTYPGARETCDGYDRDCDGDIGDGAEEWWSNWYPDADGDGYGDASGVPVRSCMPPEGSWAMFASDCDDSDPDIAPVAEVEYVHQADEGMYSHDEIPYFPSLYSYRRVFGRPDCADNPDNPQLGFTEEWGQDRTGRVWGYHTYDANCRVISTATTRTAGGSIDEMYQWEYDEDGRKVHEAYDRWGDGVIDSQTTWTYDEDGVLIREERDPNGDGVFALSYACTYEADGLSYTCFRDTDLDGEGDQWWIEVWSEDGLLEYSKQYQEGGGHVERTYSYDDAGRVLTVHAGSYSVERYSYDPSGRWAQAQSTRLTDGRVVGQRSWRFDPWGRETEYTNVNEMGEVWTTLSSHTRSGGRRALSWVIDESGDMPSRTLREWDPAGKLTYSITERATQRLGYRYDALGRAARWIFARPGLGWAAEFSVYEETLGYGEFSWIYEDSRTDYLGDPDQPYDDEFREYEEETIHVERDGRGEHTTSEYVLKEWGNMIPHSNCSGDSEVSIAYLRGGGMGRYDHHSYDGCHSESSSSAGTDEEFASYSNGMLRTGHRNTGWQSGMAWYGETDIDSTGTLASDGNGYERLDRRFDQDGIGGESVSYTLTWTCPTP